MNLDYNEGGPFDFPPLLSLLPIAVFIANDQGKVVFCNKMCVTTIGTIEGNFFGKVHDATSKAPYDFLAICRQVLSGLQPDSALVSVTNTSTQRTGYYKLSARLFHDKYVLFSAVDQTEKVELEQMIEEKRTQFFSIMNSLGDLVFKLDRKGNITNRWSQDFPEISPLFHPLEGTHLSDSFPQTVADVLLHTIRRVTETSAAEQVEFPYSYEGVEKWFSAGIAALAKGMGSGDQYIVIINEITEEKKNKQQSEYKNRLINQLTSIQDGPLLHVIEGDYPQFNFISGNLSCLTGYLADELSSSNWLDLIHDDDRNTVIQSLKKLRSRPQGSHADLLYRICVKNGDIRWISNHVSKTDAETEEGILIGVILNVTEIHSLHDKLKQRERILTNTSQVALIGGWEYDFKNRKFHFTDELYEIHERDPSEFDVLESSSYYIEDHQPLIRQYLDDLIKKGKNFDDELQLITGKGTLKWVRTVGCAEWHNGQITHIYGIIQDIHEKKMQDLFLKENERRFNAAFELAPLGIGLLSHEGRWLRVNTSLANFFELSKDRLIQIPIQELKLADASGDFFEWDDILKDDKTNHQWKEKYLTESGRIKWGRISVSAVKNESGEPSYFILQVVDITESKEYEENLIIARKEAEDANKIKSDFLSTMTHEIRTPLFGVIGITNLLLEEIQDPGHLEQLRALKFSSDSLLLLVNDILDFSKIKSGVLSLELKPFDLKRIVDAIEELNLPRAKEKANRVVIDYDSNLAATYIGDELRIGQILNNLVNNAVKFTQNGLVEASVRKTGETANTHQLLFSIRDTGIGISQDKQSTIFEQFTQADPSISRRYGGTGLGLSIAKGLVEAMDSEITLVSEPGKGTTISFGLVLKKGETEHPTPDQIKQEGEKDLYGKTVLLVEDNPVSMLVSTQHLVRWNAIVIQAVNGKKAVEMYLENKDKIDLVLMDINMPVFNGIQAAEQIKKANPGVPIIAVTASSEESETQRASIQAYLVKPYTAYDFYNIVKKHLA